MRRVLFRWDGAADGDWAGCSLALVDLRATAPSDHFEDGARAPAREPDRTFYLARRAAARDLLAERGVEVHSFAADASDAPQIVASGAALEGRAYGVWRVSFSARGPVAAVAVAPFAIGVDYEPVTDDPPVEAMLAASERRRLDTLPEAERPRAFLKLWTAKEAVVKAWGLGLTIEPADLAIESMSLNDASFAARCGTWSARGLWIALGAQFDAPASIVALARSA